jgi:uncharacterized protein YwgA
MLDPADIVLLLLCANDGRIDGRTAIQKLVYFTQLLLPSPQKLNFRPHFYGPYSSDLAALLDSLVGLRFLRTDIVRTSRQRVMYSYFLTDDGNAVASRLKRRVDAKKISVILDTCKSLTGLRPDVLSFAAKADYILRQRKQGYTKSQVAAEGKKFGWRLTPESVSSGAKVLLALKLAKQKKYRK